MTNGAQHNNTLGDSSKCFTSLHPAPRARSISRAYGRLGGVVASAILAQSALLTGCGQATDNGSPQTTATTTVTPPVAPTTGASVTPTAAPVTPTAAPSVTPSVQPTSPVTPPTAPPITPPTGSTTSGPTGPATDPASSEPASSETGTDTGGPVGSLELTELTIEENPKSVLSAFVSWKTATAASSAVQFGVDDYVWEIADETTTTDHRVLVIGMRASQKYKIKAISSSDTGAGELEGEFTTKALPAVIPVAEVSSYDPALSQPGWTLINVQKGQGDYRARSDEPPMAVMYDEEGQPVWYVISGTSPDIGGAVSTQLTDVGVLVGPQMQGGGSPREYDFASNLIWECDDARCGGTSDLSHHAGKLPNGHIVYNRDVANGNVTMPVFEEIVPPENTQAWKLDLRTVLPPPGGATGDWCHGNSITVHADKNEVYVSCRFLGVIKTTYDNPTKIWHLPASYGAEGMGDFTYDPPESQFSDIHDPEIHDDGTIMVFDNGGWDGALGSYNPSGLKSRVVEYQLDVENGVAKRVWEFPGDFEVDDWYRNNWYQPFWGDADRLPNKNVLMTAGVRGPDLRSRVFEATNDGKVVWVMQLPVDYGLYRADRVTPPLLRKLP